MKHQMRWIRSLLLIGRIAFGILFTWAAVGKIVDPDQFSQQVARYQIVGPGGSAWVGGILPWMEFIVGSCLLTGFCTPGAWLGSVLLFGCFVFARASVLARGLSIECGCGVMDGTITGMSVVISAALLLASMGAYLSTLWMALQPQVIRRTRIKKPTAPRVISGHLNPRGATPCA
jgi:uncharacterized membrane protein YphA (DoxX/SURF4 family)